MLVQLTAATVFTFKNSLCFCSVVLVRVGFAKENISFLIHKTSALKMTNYITCVFICSRLSFFAYHL